MEQMNLSDRIQYWREEPENEKALQMMFTLEERNILNTIYEFEVLDSFVTQEIEARGERGSVTETFIRVEREAEISSLLKEHFMKQMDLLLSKGTAEAWLEIIIWYSLLEEKKLILDDYWEFPTLRIMIDIFVKELNVFFEEGKQISVLALHNMQELTDAYFHTLFLCRRIEYGVEPVDEIIRYVEQKRFSSAYIHGIVDAAQIYDKEKVIETIEEWCWK